jgi:pimeloyl-ACP methyl ester carboxylesterase
MDTFSTHEPVEARGAAWPPSASGLKRRWTTVCGYRMSYVTGGSGELVLLLHGIGSDASIWRHTLSALMQRYTVYAPDMLGCGQSEKPALDYSVEAMTHYVHNFMLAVGIERAHVIGHSLGGGIALILQGLFPERVDRLALVSSGGFGRELHWLLRINALPGALQALSILSDPRAGAIGLSRALERRRMRRLAAAYDGESPTLLHRLQHPEARWAFVRMARSTVGLRGQKMSALPHLPALTKPVLLVWGERDRILPAAQGYRAAALLPNAHLAVPPHASHRPQLEAPKAFNEAVLAFLAAKTWPPEPREHRMAPATMRARRQSRRRALTTAALAVGIPLSVGMLARIRTTRQHKRPALRVVRHLEQLAQSRGRQEMCGTERRARLCDRPERALGARGGGRSAAARSRAPR